MADEPVRMCPIVEELPDGWQVKRLGSFCTKIGSGATPRGGSEVYLNSRVSHALVRSQHVFDRHFHTAGLAFISDSHAKELQNAEVQSGDVLLNITGDGVTFGRSCIVPNRVLPACVNQHVSIIRPDRRVCDPGYLLSVLTHPSSKGYIESFNSGGSRRAITKGHIESFAIPLPPLAEQKAIAAVLGALDDKIELNRRMNATLEAMARALFQSWFVDFDPVRAKLDGRRPTGLDPETAALFPESFQDSEVGHIPSGWKITTLGACIGFRSGFSFKSQDWQESGVPVVKIGSVKPGIIDLSQVSYVSEEIAQLAARYRLSTGDMLIGMTGYVGEVGLVPPSNNPPLLNQRVGKFVMPKAGTESLAFWYCTTRQPEFRAFVEARSHGTAQANVSGEAIMEFPLVAPAPEILVAFNRECQPMLDRILSNHAESRTLAILRDTLLPKLLRGEMSSALAVDLA